MKTVDGAYQVTPKDLYDSMIKLMTESEKHYDNSLYMYDYQIKYFYPNGDVPPNVKEIKNIRMPYVTDR